jgi:hypothetical protein
MNEFGKNLLLAHTRKNLLVDVGCIAGLLLVAVAIDDLSFSFVTERVAKTLFVLIVLLRGSRLISDTLIEEFHHNTWDMIRLSRQSALGLVIGKIAGRTITVWIGGLITMTAYGISESEWLDGITIIVVVTSFIVAGLIAHVVTFYAQLIAIYRVQTEGLEPGKVGRLGGQAIGLIAALPVLSQAFQTGEMSNVLDGVTWYGFYVDQPIFVLGASIFALIWALIGCTMTMRRSLSHVPGMLVLPAFLITLSVLVAGLETLPYSLYYIGMMFSGGIGGVQLITIALTSVIYAMLSVEPTGPNHIKSTVSRIKLGNIGSILRYTPRSVLTIGVLSAVVLISVLLLDPGEEAAFKLVLIAVYVGRDVFVIYGLGLNTARKRKTLTTAPIITAILLSYFVLPFGLDQIDLTFTATLVSPIVGEHWPAMLSAIVQFSLALLFCIRSLKRFEILRTAKVI